MKIKEASFRDICGKYVILPADKYRKTLNDFPGQEDAGSILTYAYIDHETGISFEVLACADKDPEGNYSLADPNDSISLKIRGDQAAEDEFEVIRFEDDTFKTKIETLKRYEPSEDILKTREMDFLDEVREPLYPDDVLVYLFRDGLQPEACWVRIEGLMPDFIIGELLNEPDQNFGWHIGEKVGFYPRKTEDGHTVCVCDMNPSMKLKKEDLKGGAMLKEAISTFNKERSQNNFIGVLEFLRDSDIWIPCNAVVSEADTKNLESLDPKKGDTFTFKDSVRMIPDILLSGEDFFFPVFTSAEEMGEYGTHFSKVEDDFLHATVLAENNEKKVTGIVVNAFSEPFVLETKLFEIIRKMKSRIIEENEE